MKKTRGFIFFILLLCIPIVTLTSLAMAGNDGQTSILSVNDVKYLSVNNPELNNIIRTKKFKIVGFTNLFQNGSNWKPQFYPQSEKNQIIYIVQPGDSLYLIATRNNMTVQQLRKLNKLKGNVIYVGQKLLIPANSDNSTPDTGANPPDNGTPDTGNDGSSPDTGTPDKGTVTDTYTVQPGDSLYLVAIKNNTTVQKLKDLNNLDNDMLLVGQKLLIPANTDNSNPDTGANPPDNGTPDTGNDGSSSPDTGTPDKGTITDTYTVQPGDSLYLIAIKNNTTVQKLKDLNNLDNDMLLVGQELLIPANSDNSTPDTGNNPPDTGNSDIPDNPDMNSPVVYLVKAGDNLWLISNKFNTTVDKLININHLSSNALYVGQLLYITSPDYNEKLTRVIYYVQAGDSLAAIAANFGTTVDKIMELNNLKTDELLVGQKLYIKIPDYSDRNYNLILDYEVETGDNIKSITNKFDLSSPWELKAYNNIYNTILSVGQKIKIPLQIPEENMGNTKNVNQEELELLSKAIYSEARGEPFNGQVAVGAVILNRVRSSVFPDNIKDVIFQPWQFTAVQDGQFWLEPNQTAYLAAKAALQGWDPSGGALYYYNPDTASDDWVFYRDVIVKIGDHYFALTV